MKVFNTPIYTVLCIAILFVVGCTNQNDSLVGTWQLVGDEGCDKSFLGLNPFIYPQVKYGHKIYISDSLFFNPSLVSQKSAYLPFEEKYYLIDNQIFVSGLEPFSFDKKDSVLIFQKAGCKLIFEQRKSPMIPTAANYERIAFSVRSDNNELLDTMQLFRNRLWTFNKTVDLSKEEEKKYASFAFRMAELIESTYLNRTFDEKVVDTNKHSITFYTTSGEEYEIVSFGEYETPFEIKILITYLLKFTNL